MRPCLAIFVMVLTGCEAKSVSLEDSGTTPGTALPEGDVDRDGYSVAEGDCDDGNPDVNPAKTEVCDPENIDEDCNGKADNIDDAAEGKVLTYRDADGDGYGDPTDPGLLWCDPPSDSDAPANDDCDDGNPAVYPAAADPTDGEGLDNDCDGFVDEDDLGPADVLLTEMYWRGLDEMTSYVPDQLYQWVEIYNNTPVVLDLSGWTVRLCHIDGASVTAYPSASACVDGYTTEAILPRGTRLDIGDYLVVCSDRSVMPTCDVDFDFTGPGMSMRHGYVDVRADGVTLGPQSTTAPTEVRLDAVSYWYIDTTDYWPNGSSKSMRLADGQYLGADWDDVNDIYGTPGGDGSPTWDIWCFPTTSQTFELDDTTRYGTPGAANGHSCD